MYLIVHRKISALRILIENSQEPNPNSEESPDLGDNAPLEEGMGENDEENEAYDDDNT